MILTNTLILLLHYLTLYISKLISFWYRTKIFSVFRQHLKITRSSFVYINNKKIDYEQRVKRLEIKS